MPNSVRQDRLLFILTEFSEGKHGWGADIQASQAGLLRS